MAAMGGGVSLSLSLLFALVAVAASQERSFTIDYTNNTFLKDGKPFRYIAGSIHYQRVPYQYWEDRLQKMYAAGLNAIQTYVPWNVHEPSPGVYDFSGQQDLVSFIQLAQKHKLLVILRPGPYICAEWEFGGFPAWLINKNPKMILRSSDYEYIGYVDKWMTELYTKIQPLMYVNGGPIIMVQVENEYGSYFACDHEYMMYLTMKARAMLGKDAVLFTTDGDGDGYLKCGTTKDAYATVDFGVTYNPAKNFAVQRKWEPKGPFVNSEFYTGWLDHWGSNHSTVNYLVVAISLDLILKYGANINMYMFEGGTNFGFGNGANAPFAPVPTSYDYDAPLSEAGDITIKYHALRNTIGKYNPLPPGDVPPSTPKYSYGTVQMNMFKSLPEYVEESCKKHNTTVMSKYPLTMEQIEHYYGFIMYRHVLKEDVESSLLNISVVRDRGYITVNQKPVGTVDRTSTDSLMISGKEGQSLDILVENQGRINYGTDILNNTKGLIGNVTLGGQVLSDWVIYPVNFDDMVNPADKVLRYKPRWRRPRQGAGLITPSFYVGELIVPADPSHPRDTYLDMAAWGKGQAFINGNNLGRYWPQRGPQVRLYVPKHFLQRGTNRIVMLELESALCIDSNACAMDFKDQPRVNAPVHPDPWGSVGANPLDSRLKAKSPFTYQYLLGAKKLYTDQAEIYETKVRNN